MECVVEGSNVKPLAKTIQVLARIGDHLYIESLSDGLYFRTVNSSRSAYVSVTFKLDFFAEYKCKTVTKCKVSLKSCLMAFRSVSTLEKSVEKCILNTEKSDFLLVQFYCKHDMMKNYHLPFIENETVQATFQHQAFQCKLTAQTKLLIDGIQNFSNSVEEVTLTICTDKVVLKNYIDEYLEQDKVVHTELTLESEEFENFEYEETTAVTFCLKEFRAVMTFSEGFNVPVTISCQSGGKPIMFSIDGIPGLQADFVLATLADRDIVPSQSVADKQLTSLNSLTRNDRKGQNKRKTCDLSSNNPSISDDITNPSEIEASTSHQSPIQTNGDDDEEMIPVTPPKKRFRYEFLGLSQSSQYTSMAPDPDEVLAEASDED